MQDAWTGFDLRPHLVRVVWFADNGGPEVSKQQAQLHAILATANLRLALSPIAQVRAMDRIPRAEVGQSTCL